MKPEALIGASSSSGLRLCIVVLLALQLARPVLSIDFHQVGAFGIKAWATRREIDLRLTFLGFNRTRHLVSRTGIETDRYEKAGQFVVLSAINGDTFELETSRVSVGGSTLDRGNTVGLILSKIGRPTRVVNNSRQRPDEWWIYEDASNSNSLGVLFRGGAVVKFRFNFV